MKQTLRCLLLLLAWLSGQALATETVTFGILSFRPKAQAQAQWKPLESYLNTSVSGHSFKIQIFDFDGLQEAIRQQSIDFVITQPAEYVRMTHQNGLSSPLATLINMEQGKPVRVFGGVILTRSKQTDINTLQDLQGKRVATASTTGFGAYQAQAYTLSKAHVDIGPLL
ncbi:MAG: PhnD/SsuA/transferrin family substrate-binding protein, partial [Polaromonas sp.]|nr:PhnD/SsuA/transferrin family substrate-binding protein [Polaromonas sp.]